MPSLAQLLEASGSHIRGNRAQCQFCKGRSQFTVSFNETKGVAFCHRCHRSSNVRGLAREQDVSIPERAPERARIRKKEFRRWLSKVSGEMANRERRLARRAGWAEAALSFYPEHPAAWNALAEWYHSQRNFELYREAARDKIGRFHLYKMWRRHA